MASSPQRWAWRFCWQTCEPWRVYAPETDALAIQVKGVAVNDMSRLGSCSAGNEEQREQVGHGSPK
jgi:hypothetical protein